MRRGLLMIGLLLWAAAAGAIQVGGATLPDTVRVTADGPELVLNGAGERWILLFKIYVIGLYLPARHSTANDVIALKSPKRILLVIQRRELTGRQVHDYLIDRIADGSQPAEMEVMKARLVELDKVINGVNVIQQGGTIALDYVPGKGTVIQVNGIVRGAPIPGEDFYNALLRIWLGEHARSATLREALLGRSG